ncbi:hypothetical protein RHMOL_Rhmol01G0066800 [Rhododendron molle]|uniref:Uncharacterized protein n=1 Tax=Rhododendron molle TaxID=49168 RepID=A0ACC0PZ03_RHOML|nr:hypothetical protein RHMOL_Rhmol01G0066800 [Rhododendron molle]
MFLPVDSSGKIVHLDGMLSFVMRILARFDEDVFYFILFYFFNDVAQATFSRMSMKLVGSFSYQFGSIDGKLDVCILKLLVSSSYRIY